MSEQQAPTNVRLRLAAAFLALAAGAAATVIAVVLLHSVLA
jgi:hypothetical protein